MKSVIIYALFWCNTQPGMPCLYNWGPFASRAECVDFINRTRTNGETRPGLSGDYLTCLGKRVEVWSN